MTPSVPRPEACRGRGVGPATGLVTDGVRAVLAGKRGPYELPNLTGGPAGAQRLYVSLSLSLSLSLWKGMCVERRQHFSFVLSRPVLSGRRGARGPPAAPPPWPGPPPARPRGAPRPPHLAVLAELRAGAAPAGGSWGAPTAGLGRERAWR